MMRNYTTIYTLNDPITNEIRYVGKTGHDLKARLRSHRASSKKRTNHVQCWISSLNDKNFKPIIEELEQCTHEESDEKEIYWIAQMKAWGFDLTNLTEGGDNGLLGYKYSKDRRDKIKATARKFSGRSIHQYDLDGNFLESFDSLSEASEKLNITVSTICLVAGGTFRKTHGSRWSYYKLERLPPMQKNKKLKPRSIAHNEAIRKALFKNKIYNIDLIDRRFSKLVIVEKIIGSKYTSWRCLCDCGKETTVIQADLFSKNTKSCGCLKRRSSFND